MARTIAIELEVNGVKESVKTIGELETAIESLTEELKNTDIGSEKFNQLTNELNKAKSELKTFEASFEGLDPQQKTQAYVAFAESVSSGILLAQEALRSFGVENENVNSAVEASTKAINFALQARILLEGALEARVLATSLAQKALNTSVVAGNRALKVLFTTIAANPLGAVLAVVGLLVTAFISLSDATEENTEETDKNNEALERQNQLREAQARIIQQAEDEIRRAREEGTQALREQADILEQRQDILDDEVDKLRDLARETLVQINQQKILRGSTEDLEKRYEDIIKQLETATEEAGANAKVLESLRKELENIDKQISQNELDRFKGDLEGARKELDKLNRSLLDFGETPTPKVIEDLEELVRQQIRLQEITEESRKTLGDVFNDYTNNVITALRSNDSFGESYETTRKQLTDAFRTGDIETFQEAIDKIYDTYFDENSNFNDEQRRTITQLLSNYRVAFQQLQQFGIDSGEEFDTIVSPLLNKLAEKLRLEGSIKFERTDTEKAGEEAGEDAASSYFDAFEKYKTRTGVELSPIVDETNLENVLKRFELFREKIEEIKQSELSLEDVLSGSEEFYNLRNELINTFSEEFLKSADIQKLAEEDRTAAQEEAIKRARETADGIINIITNTAIAEDAIRGVFNEVEDLQNQIKDNTQNVDTFLGLIIENFDEIGKQIKLEELLDPSAALEDNFQQIVSFFESIGVDSVNILFNTEEEKLAIVNLFLKKRQELLEENAEKEQEIQEKTLDDTLNNYQEIVNGLNQLTLSLGEKSQLQIERIEARREESLANVVGDTEEAEALRTEITEDANREIVEVERKARLRELQFTKIQGVADLAQALINAQKLPPPFNVIQSGIVATAGAVQLAVIESQIQDLQGAQGFATGGFVSGEGTGTSDSIPAFLSNGEFVVNAKATKQYLPLLEKINNEEQQFNKFANGGFVLDGLNIPSSNIQNIFDDSRIIEELRKTRQEPLRAYVFEKDITDAQQIEKRLQELSKL